MANQNLMERTPVKRTRVSRTNATDKARNESTAKDWTIKGLSPGTIDVTRDAARRSGMKINAWVGKALESAATKASAKDDAASRADPAKVLKLEEHILQEIASLRARNEELVQTVNGMSALLIKMYTSKISEA